MLASSCSFVSRFKIVRSFVRSFAKERDSSESVWDVSAPLVNATSAMSSMSSLASLLTPPSAMLPIASLRQLEALFNLSQLLFGLSRGETVNYTFRDLQLRKHPHSFRKSGGLRSSASSAAAGAATDTKSQQQQQQLQRIDFYAVFEELALRIVAEGGLDTTMLIYRRPMLPMVRQKCLDLISNVATVPDIAAHIMRTHAWFLDHLLVMVRDGDIIADKIPALSVLIRLLKLMLTERMCAQYMKLVDMQYIDCLVDIFESPHLLASMMLATSTSAAASTSSSSSCSSTHDSSSAAAAAAELAAAGEQHQHPSTADAATIKQLNECLPFFVKFEFISMQSLTVILGDAEYSRFWSDKAK